MIPPHFHNPWFLAGLAGLPLLAWDRWRRDRAQKASIRFPTLAVAKRVPPGWALRARHLLPALRLGALALMVVALARPQWGEAREETSASGVDIVLALDVSGSMRTMDFKPRNRLFVAKRVIEEFILGRKHDRLGLVVFAGRSYTQCPLTLDYGILVDFLRKVDFGAVDDGTAIGTAILNAANRLRSSPAKSKVVILLTDGENNSGEVDPLTAARAAKALGIRIYTVGVGKEGEQPLEVQDPLFGTRIVNVRTDVDEKSLKEIADLTGGKFYRAQDAEALADIYHSIDRLEKTEIKTASFYRFHETFPRFLWPALALLALEIVLANTRFMRIP